MRNLFQRSIAIVFAAAALAANAGGPLSLCSAGSPVKYPGAGSVTMNYDLGTLGSRTNAQAAAIVNAALATWTNVSTATITMTRGSNLPVDVTTANYTAYLGNSSFGDGLNPVVYDTDGTLTDLMLGAGASNNVLGFAGSAYNISPCGYVEGRAIINGKLAVSDATMTTVLTHELGHFIGLDHTQLDGAQGLATSNYPLMYPIAYRTNAGLHEDDTAAISALYPDSTVNSTYGTLTGTFVTSGGAPIRGANIWAQNTSTGQVFSVVSDYLQQGTGYFKLLLTPGTYILHAEAIDTGFTGGSGVGPFSNDLTDASFQPPLYSAANGGGSPMAPVTMSQQIAITAGCAASVTFAITGVGTIGSSCATPSAITSPVAGSTLSGASVTFTWNSGTGTITDRFLMVGTTPGGQEIYGGSQGGTALSRTVSGIPTTGVTIYVRLMSMIGGAWQSRDYTYTAAALPTPSVITNPAPGSTLPAASVTFFWDAGYAVTARYFSVGTTPGGSQIYGADQGGALSRTVSNLPTDGSTVYVRLTSTVNGSPQSIDYTYTAVLVPIPSVITSPANGSTLAGSSATFSWTAGRGVTERYLAVGTTLNGSDLYSAYQGVATMSRTVTGIPADGRTIYVRLLSWINGNWEINSYTYTALNNQPTPVASSITSPTPGSTLGGASATFTWDVGAGVTERYLAIGTTLNGSDLYSAYQGVATMSRTVTGLPTDGRTIYVRLLSWINGNWSIKSYTYMAANTTPAPVTPVASSITSPAPGSTLAGSSATFSWDVGSGVTERYLAVGTTLNGSDLYSAYQGVATMSRTVTGLPTTGGTIYVRLFSWINGDWQIRSYTYTAANIAPVGPAPSSMLSPVAGSVVRGGSATFSWDAGSGVTERYLAVSTSPTGQELYSAYQGVATMSRTVSGLPTNGATIYVRLFSWINGDWQVKSYSYATGP